MLHIKREQVQIFVYIHILNRERWFMNYSIMNKAYCIAFL